jgi:ribonuclease HI
MHESFGGRMYDPKTKLCHHYQIVFTDGACSNNGQGYAEAGLGIAIGDGKYSWSIAVDDTMDSGPRTSQRAELLAAINGLKKLKELRLPCFKKSAARHRASPEVDNRAKFIVVTDSEYVVKGITEWFPAWRVRLVIHPIIFKH